MRSALRQGLSLVLLLFSATACSSAIGNREITVEKHYLFNPDTVLESMHSNADEAFVPVGDVLTPDNSTLAYAPVIWKQQDYSDVADAVMKLVQAEPSEKWKIQALSFGLMCNEVASGPQGATLLYFREEFALSGVSFLERQVSILPRTGEVDLWEFTYQGLQNWTAINMNRVAILAEDALQIAEKNGGNEKRKEVNNDCEISLLLSAREKYSVWEIIYSPGVLYMLVDSSTGKTIK